jgi:hypothetical protein
LSYANFLDALLSKELAAKREKALTLRARPAHFSFVKTLETFDFLPSALDRPQTGQGIGELPFHRKRRQSAPDRPVR